MRLGERRVRVAVQAREPSLHGLVLYAETRVDGGVGAGDRFRLSPDTGLALGR